MNSSTDATIPATALFHGRWDRRSQQKALTVNSGSHIKVRFTGTRIEAFFDLALNEDPVPTITWQIDDGEWKEADIAPTVLLAEKLSSGEHSLILMARGLSEHQSRWSAPLVASITFTGFRLQGGEFISHPKETGPKLEFIGDSITEGILVQPQHPGVTRPWVTDGRMGYAGQTAMALNAQWRQVGFGYQGMFHLGNGNVPPCPETFNFFHAECPRDDWQPDAFILNHGTNDRDQSPEIFAPRYAEYLDMVRRAYPKALLISIIPFCGAFQKEISAIIEARKKSGDTNVACIDASGWLDKVDYFGDGKNPGELHPNALGSTVAAKHLVAELRPLLQR